MRLLAVTAALLSVVASWMAFGQPACQTWQGSALGNDLRPLANVSIEALPPAGFVNVWPSCWKTHGKTNGEGVFFVSARAGASPTFSVEGDVSVSVLIASDQDSRPPVVTTVNPPITGASGPSFQQMAACSGANLLGAQVETSFLDLPTDPRVRCPSGELVPATLVLRDAGQWRGCRSLCPTQTCFELRRFRDVSAAVHDVCLVGNVRKHFFYAGHEEAASDEAAILWMLQTTCRSDTLSPEVQSSLQALATTFDPLEHLASRIHVVIDKSGSMSQVATALEQKLADDFQLADKIVAFDSQLSESGDLGQKLLKVLAVLAGPGSMVLVVADFQDGATESLCQRVTKLAVERRIVIMLESVDRDPQPCIVAAASVSGGATRIGRLARK